jgi:hypothetical protein
MAFMREVEFAMGRCGHFYFEEGKTEINPPQRRPNMQSFESP